LTPLVTQLQAFRHLYVLATQPRSVDAIDVDTKQVGRWACTPSAEFGWVGSQ
jgi:hypothetical protein